MTAEVQIPSYNDLLWPTLRAVREIGDSGTNEEIVEKVTELEGFSEEQQTVPHGDAPLRDRVPARMGAYLSQGDGGANEQQTGCVEHNRGWARDDAGSGRDSSCGIRRTAARG